jgi:hypothetical protein
VFTTGPPKHSGTPCANGFNGLLRALPGDRAFLSPSLREILAKLDVSVETSEPRDFAVRIMSFVFRYDASTASRSQRS